MKDITRVLPENERSFYEKYGVSLQEKWDALEGTNREEKIKRIERFSADTETERIHFKQEDILRIIIGYRGRKCLNDIVDKTNHTTRAVIWEPDTALFLAGCVYEDISDFISDERITFVLGREDKAELTNAFKQNVYEHNIHHRSIYVYGEYFSEDNEDVKCFGEIFGRISQEVIRHGTLRRVFDQLPCENMLFAVHNLNNNFTVNQLFENIPTRDVPVIIVSAGPSLEKNAKELARAFGKAIIIAVTHAMKTLNSLDIEPDIVAVTDAKDKYFSSSDRSKRYYILSSVFAEKNYQKAFDGRVIYHGFGLYEGLFDVGRTVSEYEFQLDTGSVSTDVFSLFMTAGFRTIILVGQDLAFDKSGYSHANNETENGQIDISGKYFEIEGIFGDIVKTRSDWIGFRDFFEQRIGDQSMSRVIDATEGGALIKGTEIMTLEAAIDKFCVNDYPVSEWLRGLDKGDDKEKEEINDWFDLMEINCIDTSKHIHDAILLNEEIQSKWNRKELWDDSFAASCKRYDIIYNIVIDGSRSELLRCFCAADIQDYLENALIYEGDENIEKRMQMEHELLVLLNTKIKELIEYIGNLKTDLSCE